MLRILHVTAAAERGGLEVILLNILKGLDRSRFTPEVLLLEDGPFVREVRETGTKTHVIRAGRVREIVKGGKAISSAVQLIRQQEIGLVHSHNAKAHIYGGLAAAIARVPSLYHLHGVPKPSPTRDGLVSLLSVITPARRTVACSAYVGQRFLHAWSSTREVAILHNGVIPESNVDRNAARGVRVELGIPQDVPLVVMVSRLQRWKGVHIFVDAAAEVVKHYPEAFFVVAGGTLFGLEDVYATELQKQVERLGLTEAFRFTGFRPDILRFFAAADVVVHSSIEPDPFPTVLLEAMACGKPVIASDLGGPGEIIDKGVTGLLVPPESAEAVANAIKALLQDPGRRVRMGEAGAARLRECFSAERMVRQLQALYEGMAAGRPD